MYLLKRVFGMGFLFGRVTSAVSVYFPFHVSVVYFVSLRRYPIRLNDPPLSGIPSYLRVNRVLLSESLKLFSVLSRRMLHNLICLSLFLAKDFLSRQAPGFLWLLKI